MRQAHPNICPFFQRSRRAREGRAMNQDSSFEPSPPPVGVAAAAAASASPGNGKCLKLFGVILAERGGGADEEEVMRKSASMGNLTSCATFAAPPDQGYLSDVGPIGGSRRPRGGERKRGVPWTEEEHKTFLAGLKKHGKGDWRGISRDFVPTRTPTQVASHAQKYFLRHSNPNKKKRRCSLFDVVIDETATNEGTKGTDHPIHLCQDEHLVGSPSFNTIQSLSRVAEPLSAKVDCNKTPSSESVNLMLEISSSKTQCLPAVTPKYSIPEQATPMFYPNSVSFDPDFLKLTLSSSYIQTQWSSASQLLDNSDLELTVAPPQPENPANLSCPGVAGAIRVV